MDQIDTSGTVPETKEVRHETPRGTQATQAFDPTWSVRGINLYELDHHACVSKKISELSRLVSHSP
jgi:hypothetical protein